MDNQDQELWDLLGRVERRDAPAGFAVSVMRRIAREEERVEKKSRWFDWFKVSSPLAWSAATGAAAMLCAAVLFSDSVGTGDPVSLAAEIDDEVLMDVAGSSLGDEALQDAVYQVAAMDSRQLTESDIEEMILNG